jgi:alpha-tubulin suppressor-like RCC1 family protein
MKWIRVVGILSPCIAGALSMGCSVVTNTTPADGGAAPDGAATADATSNPDGGPTSDSGTDASSSADSGADTTTNPGTDGGATTSARLAVAAGFVCAAARSGVVSCWGTNGTGQLGNGAQTDSPLPQVVQGVSSPVQLAIGAGNAVGTGVACALLGDGTVSCWGDNSTHLLGRDATLPGGSPGSATAGAVPSLTDVKQLAVSTGAGHACALKQDGSVVCWGANTFGQCGQPTATDPVLVPTPVTALGTDVASVSVGNGNACAVKKSDGSVVCWGVDDMGQTGVDPATVTSMCGPSPGLPCVLTPTAVPGITGASGVAAGGPSTCVLEGGAVSCFGTNFTGTMLNAFEAPQGQLHATPVALPAPLSSGIVSLAAGIGAGKDWACARTSGSDTLCWGSNTPGAQLAQEPGNVDHVPDTANNVAIQSISAIAAAQSITVPTFDNVAVAATVCGIGADLSLWCWGEDAAGEVTNASGNGIEPAPTVSHEHL